MSVWKGRVDTADGALALRWHQRVKPLAPDVPPGVTLLGFACDEGVRRTQGRVGAAGGPKAIRSGLADLAWHQEHPAYDAGDVVCTSGDLDDAQKQLSQAVHDVIAAGHRPLVLGGGHETAWGSYRGLVRAIQGINPTSKIGIINLDAHFDLRADTQGSSGTPFAQIAHWCRENDRLFWYLCLGIAEPANTAALFDRAKRFEVQWMLDTDLEPLQPDAVFNTLQKFLQMVDILHLSIDLDVLPGAVMPAVSSPAAHGVPLSTVEAIVAAILGTGRVGLVELVEFNPTLDTDGRAVRTAARLAWLIAKSWPALLA